MHLLSLTYDEGPKINVSVEENYCKSGLAFVRVK